MFLLILLVALFFLFAAFYKTSWKSRLVFLAFLVASFPIGFVITDMVGFKDAVFISAADGSVGPAYYSILFTVIIVNGALQLLLRSRGR